MRLHPSNKRRDAEAAGFVQAFLASADEKKRNLFILAVLEEIAVPEVAAALAIPLNTAYTRLRAVRAGFARALERSTSHDRGRASRGGRAGPGPPRFVPPRVRRGARAPGNRRRPRAGRRGTAGDRCAARADLGRAAPGGGSYGGGEWGRGLCWAGHRAALRDVRSVAPLVQATGPTSLAPSIPPPSPPAAEPEPSLAPLAPLRSRHGGHGALHEAENRARAPRQNRSPSRCARYRNIDRALRDGKPGLAVAFLEELEWQVPHGQLTEERDAAATPRALRPRADGPFGVDPAEEFAERYPRSVYRARVEQACAETDSPVSGDSPSRRSRE